MILYITVFFALTLVVISGITFLFGSSTQEESRVFRRFCEVTGYQQGEAQTDLDEELLEGSFWERNIYPIVQRVGDMLSGDEQDSWDKLNKRLIRAGRPGGLEPNEFAALQLVMGLLSVALVVLLALLVRPTSTRGIAMALLFAAVMGIASYIVPKFYLSKMISNREQEAKSSLPFAIDLLVVTVEAGLGFEMALKRVSEKMTGPLAEEFQRVNEEIQLGATRRQALQNLLERLQVEELSSLVSAIIQAGEMGASVGKVLRIQADQMRTERRQQIEEQAQKAPVKMLIPMVMFIFPTIFIIIGGPIGLKLMDQFRTMQGMG
ncbi:MAG: type II secretion system F family protein [bacterium]